MKGQPLYQNEVKRSAFDMEMCITSHANKSHFHKKGRAFGLILNVRVFGTRSGLLKYFKQMHLYMAVLF